MERTSRATRLLAAGAVAAAVLLSAPASSLASFTNPIAGWWPMNEGKGQTVRDWSGNGNHGTLGSTPAADDNDPSWVDGRLGAGRALAFGGDDYITIPPSRSLEPKRITVSTWLRGDVSPGLFRYVVSKGGAGCGGGASYGLYTGATDGMAFYIFDGTTYHVSPAATVGSVWDGRWHNIAGTFDGKRVRLYVDGRQVGSGTPVPAGTAIDYSLPNGGGTVGTYPDIACDLMLMGNVDTVRIWSQALPVDIYWRLLGSLFSR